VLTFFQVEGQGQLLAVDRGWLARNQVANLPTLDQGQVTLQGVLYQPERQRLLLGPNQTSDGQWPREMQRFEPDSLTQELGRDVAPLRLILAPKQPGSLQYSPPEIALSSARHQAYAWQFFALALLGIIALIITRVSCI